MYENLIKGKSILRKALNYISHARASTSKTDKTYLCDKNYDDNKTLDSTDHPTQTSTNPKKFMKLKNLKEKAFEYNKEVHSDSVSSLIADLHVEIIYLFHKISLRILGLNMEKNLQIMKSNKGKLSILTLSITLLLVYRFFSS